MLVEPHQLNSDFRIPNLCDQFLSVGHQLLGVMLLNFVFVVFFLIFFLTVAILKVLVTKNACLHHSHEPHLLFNITSQAFLISARPTFLHV